MIDFEPTEEQLLMQQSVADFAKSTLAARVREFEHLRSIPQDVRKIAHEMGIGLVALPQACGGHDQGLLTAVMIEEELGSADAAAAFGLPGPGAFGHAVVELGTQDQAARYLSDFAESDSWDRFGAVAWSEPTPNKAREGFVTTATATGDTYCINGKKSFVTNATLANRFVVFAQVDEDKGWNGIGAFVIERDAKGLSLKARHDTLGLDAANFAEIELSDVTVDNNARLWGHGTKASAESSFLMATLRYFSKWSLVIAARAVGLSRTAYQLAQTYCETRVAFGKPIGHFQAVAFTLADRLMDVDSSRWLVWQAAHAWDTKQREQVALSKTAQAVAHALEATMRTGDDCVSLHGGAGFIRDLVAEKLMRDAKQLSLCCPTAEHFDQLASALDLGIPLNAAMILPTPDTQAIFT